MVYIIKIIKITLTERKLAEHSLATALANNVLPQPGGPQKSTPLEGYIPNLWNFSGCSIGNKIISYNYFLVSYKPPISSHFTLGTSTVASLKEAGLHFP